MRLDNLSEGHKAIQNKCKSKSNDSSIIGNQSQVKNLSVFSLRTSKSIDLICFSIS
jgi:hypothetical protein